MWWIIIIIAALVVIIYNVVKDKDDNTREGVTQFGGMRAKYSLLVQFMEHSNAHITKQTKDSLVFSTKNGQWWLDYVGSNLEIRHKAVMPYLGKISKKWSYSDSYPQELIIQDLLNYSQWLFTQMSAAAASQINED